MRYIVCLFFVAFGVIAEAAPWKLVITVSDSNGGSFGANLVFDGNIVSEFGPDASTAPLATYNLLSHEWVEGGSGQRVTLAQAREWAEETKARSLVSMERLTDVLQRAFLQELLAPSFAVSESADGIQLKSRFLNYAASEFLAISNEVKKQIYAFDELNAFRKAMVLRQMPPFTQLEVTRVLREKGVIPSLLVTEITTPNGSVRVTTRYTIIDLSLEAQEKAKASN